MGLIIKINEQISIEENYPLFNLNALDMLSDRNSSELHMPYLGFKKERIKIKKRWFNILSPSEVVRQSSDIDGYYRVIYIQVNWSTGEYYIGKSNRPTWKQLNRYQGSGLRFRHKYKKHKHDFVRYFIAACNTALETERLEASIVDHELLMDEKCLNLIAGGGGINNKRSSKAESSVKKREYMLKHPEQFKPMLEASIKAFQSGDTAELRARNKKIKETMNDDFYRDMSRDRIANWKNNNPEDYTKSRLKNLEAIKSPEVQNKRKASLDKWRSENPEEHVAWQQKLIESRMSPEVKAKRKASLKAWNKNNPEQAKQNAQKRAKAAAAKTSKAVSMLDLETGEVLKTFASQHAAARWLVEQGLAKNTNCVSSIGAVCLRKPCSTGYGYRKKAYGFGWSFYFNEE
ncbi:hypothetical protein [Thalassotalea crassostreae]|uniref:hypothetical protein n=1 Tax=Thalassotalea crassostreae TaxID=1763536 RepID=UPI000837D0DE|nr:hypothetical protein [Thalassotalea crassostreae]